MLKLIQILVLSIFIYGAAAAQSDSIVLRDLKWDNNAPAGLTELFIPSDQALLAGFIYTANGSGKHPTLLLLQGKALVDKQIVMLDEHHRNKEIADGIRAANTTFFKYEVWDTDHPFTNKRVSMMNELIAFLKR